MFYLIKQIIKDFGQNNLYEVIETLEELDFNKNYNNYIYSDKTKSISFYGLPIPSNSDCCEFILKAVDEYKINKRIKKLNKI